ncbi:MAG: hypothetical protein KKB03_01485 [Nanoarchaeota archaeon]|nr:hypothetical protein [Nanoarchaeota archaeon]MBU1135250.1 hypothetical protein [Nanoarchaeota archaeon]MBU2519900.1 hypothetical protein [Nanoarchaeota archaeon]
MKKIVLILSIVLICAAVIIFLLNLYGFENLSQLISTTTLCSNSEYFTVKDANIGMIRLTDGSMTKLSEKISEIGDSALSGISDLTCLEYLDLSGLGITDVSAIEFLTNLKYLSLLGTSVSINDCIELSTVLINAEIICPVLEQQSGSSQQSGQQIVYTVVVRSDINGLLALDEESQERLNRAVKEIGDSALKDLCAVSEIEYLRLHTLFIHDISALTCLKNLRVLIIADNLISDISPLGELTKLEKIYASANRFSDIASLGTLTDLSIIDVSYDYVSDISALSSLTKLETVILKYTPLYDVSPLYNLNNLENVYLTGSNVTAGSCNQLKTNIPGADVTC